ncbi:MAG: SUMF1/EgtB/PvdO family nonheme iron enzyme [Candidatus Competibacteraceae bacterium]|nr:SUMF1/EgtB/PvdO family nonheme iron enzyme [Candidatus Competibacteraceae bacterium]
MTKKSNTLPIGYRLHHYRVEAVLGAGGFGITYMAVHEALRSRAAIKEYFPVEWSYRDSDAVNVLANTQGGLPTSEAGEEACYTWGLERFLNEARILAQVNHPSVVRVKDFFEANGTAYIVMDYEDGEPLSRVLQREKTLPEQQIRRLLDDVLPALESVHSLGYLHRDLKPANLYCRADGRTILIDFGAARQALSRRSKNITSVFTVGYSPIEQYLVEGKGYGPWTDVYALGAVLYQCVTGKQPLEAPARVLDDPLEPAEEAVQGQYSPVLLQLIDQAMAVRPEKRFQTIAKMRAALEDEEHTVIQEQLPQLRSDLNRWPKKESLAEVEAIPQVIPSDRSWPKKAFPRLDWRWGMALLGLLAVAAGIKLFLPPIQRPDSSGDTGGDKPPVVTPDKPAPSVLPTNPQAGQVYKEPLTGMEFVWIASGCFTMGSLETEKDRSANEAPHQVCPPGFWMGKYEVTNAQYRRFNGKHDSGGYQSYTLNGEDQPAVRVSWQEAAAYADWLSGQSALRFRLPTEAEWEYAARGGKTNTRDWGDNPNQACGYANIYDETARKNKPFNWANYPCEDMQVVAAPIGKYLVNNVGLYDMLGNVAEWTCSEYDNAYSGGETRCADRETPTGGRRVLRGGSWSDYPGLVRFAYRFPAAPEYRKFDLGFRLVLEP